MKKNRKSFCVFATAFIGFCVLIGVVCFLFYGQVQKMVREESDGYLKEVARRISTNISQIVENTYSQLHSFVNILEQSDANSFVQFKDIASKENQWNYEDMFLIDIDGNAYDVDGKKIAISGEFYLQEVMLGHNQSMSPMQIISGKESAIFTVALKERIFDHIPMVALMVTYEPEVFAQVLSMTSFENRAYAHIVTKDGTILIQSASEESGDFGYNIFASIDKAATMNSKDGLKYKQDIKNNQTGQITFEMNGKREYMVYTPIPPDEWYLLTFVPTEVVNAKSNLLLRWTIIISGFITLSFTMLAAIMLVVSRRYQRNIEKIAYVDEVTQGNTIARFYELASVALKESNHPPYALVYSNINKFKVLNETYGRCIGDEVLNWFSKNIAFSLREKECIGRLAGDNFCILVEYENATALRQRFEDWYAKACEHIIKLNPVWGVPVIEFGIYIIEDESMLFPQMIDRAKLALQAVPYAINAKLRYGVYNDKIRAQLFREKHLEDQMEKALANGEFKMYLQPKVSTANEKIVGAEALARWESTAEGMIFPDEFIPLFEKNGFIIQLDMYIFEEVCKLMGNWIKNDEKLIKISVNCSRAHLKDINFIEGYSRIAEKYKVPPQFIEIELTESIVISDMEYFKLVIERIHEAGFECSMDDFGSGYSSLNMIKDLFVDTIKLDRIFFTNTEQDMFRAESVVHNIINMAKALSMETVAEGIEEKSQVLMLRRVGCDLIQGYVFAKPMAVEEFLQMCKEKM